MEKDYVLSVFVPLEYNPSTGYTAGIFLLIPHINY